MTNITSLNSFLSFKLGEETFAANVGKVLNILEMTKITKVPKAPDYMLGVINLRGSVLPVIDTKIKFGLPATQITAATCILVLEVIVEGESLQVGGMVDSVQEVLEIEHNQIMPPPSLGNNFRSEFITGVYKVNDEEFIMILDMDKIFNTKDVSLIGEQASLINSNSINDVKNDKNETL